MIPAETLAGIKHGSLFEHGEILNRVTKEKVSWLCLSNRKRKDGRVLRFDLYYLDVRLGTALAEVGPDGSVTWSMNRV